MGMNEGMKDLKQIEELKEKNQKLSMQIEFLQSLNREAATRINKLEDQVESLINTLTKLRKDGL